MAGKISDYIIQKLMASEQRPQSPQDAPPQAAVGPAPMPNQVPMQGPQQGGQVDPKIDFIAKKLAMLEGSPEQKYSILIQLIPQIADVLGTPSQVPQGPQGGEYDVQAGGMGQP